MDRLIQDTTTFLLGVSEPTVLSMLKIGIDQNADIWIRVVRDKVADRELLKLAEKASNPFQRWLTKQRTRANYLLRRAGNTTAHG